MRTEQEMFPLVEQWQKSGLTKKQFALNHNINDKTFIYWHYKYIRKQSLPISDKKPISFIELEPYKQSQTLHLEIALENGVTVRIYK